MDLEGYSIIVHRQLSVDTCCPRPGYGVDGRDRQTDGRTDARPLRSPCNRMSMQAASITELSTYKLTEEGVSERVVVCT